MAKVKGFKVFHSDWTCSPNGHTKQYTCPGKFEEEGELDICSHGMHFCQTAADCFNYYCFNSENKVAEVIAYGNIKTAGNKLCTDKLEIVREIPWDEVLRIVNTGKGTPGTTTPDTTTLGTATSDTTTPGTTTPETVTLVTGTLGTATPGTAIPVTGTPEAGTLVTGTLVTGTNRLLILVVLIQRNRKSCCSISRQI